MAITVNHQFVSAKGDGSDATLVRPSNWNASHNINLAANNIIGRKTAGPGLAEEIPASTYMMDLLATANFDALAAALGLPTTGDARLTFKVVASAGWVLANDGSIGDDASGATTLANTVATVALFTFFYTTFSDAVAPLQSSTGAATTRAAMGTAATAFAAHCRMLLPRQLGRALIVAGTGATLTNRPLGTWGGEETHIMAVSELAVHTHTQQGTFAGSGTSAGSGGGTGSGSVSATGACNGDTGAVSNDHSHFMSFYSGAADRDINHLHNLGGSTGSMNRSNPHHHSYTEAYDNPVGVRWFDTHFEKAIRAANTSDTDINHEHSLPATTGASDRSIDHLHLIQGSTGGISANHSHHLTNVPVSVSGSCSVTSMSVSVSGSANVNTTLSGQTAGAGSSAPFNVMQPYAAWNIMIKL